MSEEFEVFTDDGRGGKTTDSFYDTFPELEIEAISFVADACTRKSADFTASDLAKFIDSRYYKITEIMKTEDQLISSDASCTLDLRRWSAKFDKNNQRPYFEGHVRSDVVAYTQQLISYFLKCKDHYYILFKMMT